MLYQVYNHKARGPEGQWAIGRRQLNEATNHTVHVSNHGACITFMAPSESFEGWLHHYIYIYVHVHVHTCIHVYMYMYIHYEHT